uniref:Dentin sialophosphoprotein-like n=1 Tax=Panagrellus redivivus TaxID=6233 RepID=A0A7E4VWI6_PANRE
MVAGRVIAQMRAKFIILCSITLLCVIVVAGDDEDDGDKKLVVDDRPEFETAEGKSESESKSSESAENEPQDPEKEEEDGDDEPVLKKDDDLENVDEDDVVAKEVVGDITPAAHHSVDSDKLTTPSNASDLAIHVQFEDDPSADASGDLQPEDEISGEDHPADQIPPQPKDEILVRRTRETLKDDDDDEVELTKSEDQKDADDEVELTKPDDIKDDDEAELTKVNEINLEEDPIPTTVSTKVYAIKVDKPLKGDNSDNANTSFGATVSLLDGPGIEEVGFESQDLAEDEEEELFSNIPAEALSITKKKRSDKNGTLDDDEDSAEADSKSVGSSEESKPENIAADKSEKDTSESNDDGDKLIADESVETVDADKKLSDEAELNDLIDLQNSSSEIVPNSGEKVAAKIPLPHGIRTVIPESRRRNITKVNVPDEQETENMALVDTDDDDLPAKLNDNTESSDGNKNLDDEAELSDISDARNSSDKIAPKLSAENETESENDDSPALVANFGDDDADDAHDADDKLADELDVIVIIDVAGNSSEEVVPLDSLDDISDSEPVDTVLVSSKNATGDLDDDSLEDNTKELVDHAYGSFKESDSNETSIVPKKDVLSDPFETKLESIESTESDETVELLRDEPIYLNDHVSDKNATETSAEAAGVIAANTKKIHIDVPIFESAESNDDPNVIAASAEKDIEENDHVIAASAGKTNQTDDDILVAPINQNSNVDDISADSTEKKLDVDDDAIVVPFDKTESKDDVTADSLEKIADIDDDAIVAPVDNNDKEDGSVADSTEKNVDNNDNVGVDVKVNPYRGDSESEDAEDIKTSSAEKPIETDDVIAASSDKSVNPYHVDSEDDDSNDTNAASNKKSENPYVVDSDEDDTSRVVQHRVEVNSASAEKAARNSSDYDVLDNLRDDVDQADKSEKAAAKADRKSPSPTEVREEKFSIHRPSYRYLVASDAGTDDAIVIKETRNRRQAVVSTPVEVKNRKTQPFEVDEDVESDEDDKIEYSPNDAKVAEMLKNLADAMEKDLQLNDEPLPDSESFESGEHPRLHHGFEESESQERFHNKNFKIFPEMERELDSDPSSESSYSSEEASISPDNSSDEDYEPIVIPMDLPAERTHLLSQILGISPKDGPVMIEPEGVRNGFGPGTNQNIDDDEDLLSSMLTADANESADDVLIVGAKTAVIEITKKITLTGDDNGIDTSETSIQAPPIDLDRPDREPEQPKHDKNFYFSFSISPLMLILVVIIILVLVSIKLLYTHCLYHKTSDPRPPVYTIAPTNAKGSSSVPKEVIIDSKIPIV